VGAVLLTGATAQRSSSGSMVRKLLPACLPACSHTGVLVGRLLCPAGNGRSQKPSLLDRSTWWTVDDHFLLDVPAVLEYVLNTTGAQQVHWVGHSMVSLLCSTVLVRGFTMLLFLTPAAESPGIYARHVIRFC
jgi:pimeloyl-ACP methyl ester carboxylesterase